MEQADDRNETQEDVDRALRILMTLREMRTRRNINRAKALYGKAKGTGK